MVTKFVQAYDSIRDEVISEATNWLNEPNQNHFEAANSLNQRFAITAVAEYLANKKGFTLYECNATYPKVKEDG